MRAAEDLLKSSYAEFRGSFGLRWDKDKIQEAVRKSIKDIEMSCPT